jgi:hypothetical protein
MKSLAVLGCVLGLASAGCVDRGPPPGVFESINGQVDHMHTQEGAHAQAMEGASSLAAVQAEEAAHRDHVLTEFDTIRTGIDALAKCKVRYSVPLDTSGFHAALQDVIEEADQHGNAIRALVDLSAANEVELRHTERMVILVTYLRAQRDDLAKRADGAECP